MKMKKGFKILGFLFLITFLSVGFISASWLSNFWGKVTGHVTSDLSSLPTTIYSYGSDVTAMNQTWIRNSGSGGVNQAGAVPYYYTNANNNIIVYYHTAGFWYAYGGGIEYLRGSINTSNPIEGWYIAEGSYMVDHTVPTFSLAPEHSQVPSCTPSWGSWGACSVSCGNGTQIRNDGCGNNQTQTCNTQACVVVNNSTNTTNTNQTAQNTTSTDPVPVSCNATTSCTTAPTSCPDEGKQTKVCLSVHADCTTTSTTEEIVCTPGICSGCTYLGKCVEHGFRITESGISRYCNTNDEFSTQKAENSTCQNNYECSSNQCSDSICVNLVNEIRNQGTLLVRILCWLSNPFDSAARQDCIGIYS